MGDRAHYVIKDGHSWERYYSQWGASSLELDMLPGPRFAVRFARLQRRDPWWMNECECDGAALIDIGGRSLLWFSRFLRDPAYRSAALAVLARTWRGWSVGWAYDGLAEIVAAVGDDGREVRRWRSIPVPDGIRTPEEFMAAMPQFQLNPEVYPPGREMPRELPLGVPPVRPASGDAPPCMITIVRDGRTSAYMAADNAADVIENGARVLETCGGWAPVTSWPVFPDSGVHLDTGRRVAGVWTLGSLYRILDETGARWPGWEWDHWRDRYREQLDLAGDAIGLPEPDPAEGLRRLAERFEEHQALGPGARALSAFRPGAAVPRPAESAEDGFDPEAADPDPHRPMEPTEEERAGVRAAFAALS